MPSLRVTLVTTGLTPTRPARSRADRTRSASRSRTSSPPPWCQSVRRPRSRRRHPASRSPATTASGTRRTARSRTSAARSGAPGRRSFSCTPAGSRAPAICRAHPRRVEVVPRLVNELDRRVARVTDDGLRTALCYHRTYLRPPCPWCSTPRRARPLGSTAPSTRSTAKYRLWEGRQLAALICNPTVNISSAQGI